MATDVFDLFGKIKLDTSEYRKELGNADKSFSDFGAKIKAGLGKITKASASAIGAGAAAVGKIVKDSVAAYGEYEQLVGGAKKIFDEMDYSIIAEDAANAFKDLNMSASQYLESINLAGATFAQTMGDQKGYDTARRGMLAIADFASGTGKNLTELNQKYQMITRSASSYQSIADQFAGILPQTSDDFLKQAQAAGLLSTEYTKLTEVPVDEYQQAVTAMLEKGVQALGLSQNTARESTETLTGSMAMTKAAWDNLVTGFADPDADLGRLIDDVFASASASFENILPTVERALEGLANAIPQLAPKISKSIKTIVPKILPDLLESGATLIGSLGVGLLSSLPDLTDAGISIMAQLNSALRSSNIDTSEALNGIADDMIARIPTIFRFGRRILEAITDDILSIDYKALGESVSKIAISGFDNIGKLIANIDWEKAGKDIADLISGIDWNGIVKSALSAIGQVLKATPDLIKGLLENIDFEAGATAAALFFTPKLITSLAGKFRSSSFSEVHDALSTSISAGADASGMSFGTKFKAGFEAFCVGWEIGTFIYQTFQPQIDSALEAIFNRISVAFGGDAVVDASEELMDNWQEEFQNGAFDAPPEAPQLDTFQPSSLPGVAEKLAQQQVLAAVANMQPTFAETAKSKISKLRNSFKLRGGGGVVRSPEISIVGEAGDEAVVPLKNDADGIKQIASQISRNMGNGTINNYITVNANISSENDLKDLAGKLVKYMDEGLRAAQVDSNRALGGVSW